MRDNVKTVFDVISTLGAYKIIFMEFYVLKSLIVSEIGKFGPLF